jgi:hypothetical protein
MSSWLFAKISSYIFFDINVILLVLGNMKKYILLM